MLVHSNAVFTVHEPALGLPCARHLLIYRR